MVEFKEPQAQNFNDFGNTSGLLGVDSIDNFGGAGYADFREAHTMHRLVDHRFEPSGKPKIKSLDQLKAERSNITKLTEDELRDRFLLNSDAKFLGENYYIIDATLSQKKILKQVVNELWFSKHWS